MLSYVSAAYKKSLFQNLFQLIGDGRSALTELPVWERCMHILWLLGPFVLLIERTPADVWLSLLGLTFLVRAIVQRDWTWLSHLWVRATFLFWASCLISGALSDIPSYAFGEAFVWFRFPLFAMATAFWLGRDKRLLYAMLVSTALGMMLMTGILTTEIIIEGPKHGRLTWPYDDLVPGNYLAKVGMPAFAIMVALAVGARAQLGGLMAVLIISTLSISVLTGERLNFVLRFCTAVLAGFVWRRNWPRYLVSMIALITVFWIMLAITGGNVSALISRTLTYVMNDLPFGPHSDYYRVMGGGFLAFSDAPVWGIGTASYRELCASIIQQPTVFRCDNHPHNYYVQMLAETGFLGFFTGLLMICTLSWNVFRAGQKNRHNVVSATAFIVPLGLFFPIASTADFFGQWNNIFMWSAIALSVAAAELTPEKS